MRASRFAIAIIRAKSGRLHRVFPQRMRPSRFAIALIHAKGGRLRLNGVS